MTNRHNTTLDNGVTNDLKNRFYEHKSGQGGSFTTRNNVTKLVYFELTGDIEAAIRPEKQIKAGSRQKEIDLVISLNPEWRDLAEEI